jgi:hypothetical protein
MLLHQIQSDKALFFHTSLCDLFVRAWRRVPTVVCCGCCATTQSTDDASVANSIPGAHHTSPPIPAPPPTPRPFHLSLLPHQCHSTMAGIKTWDTVAFDVHPSPCRSADSYRVRLLVAHNLGDGEWVFGGGRSPGQRNTKCWCPQRKKPWERKIKHFSYY